MANSLLTKAMEAVVGSTGEPQTAVVEVGALARFAEAIGDDNPIHREVAPPTFLRSIGNAIPAFPDEALVPRVLDGGSEWEYGVPIKVGDKITFSTTLESLIERSGRMGGMLIATYQTDYLNQDNQMVAVQRNTLIRMAPK